MHSSVGAAMNNVTHFLARDWYSRTLSRFCGVRMNADTLDDTTTGAHRYSRALNSITAQPTTCTIPSIVAIPYQSLGDLRFGERIV